MVDSDYQADRPVSARVWDYWLGGKDNYAVDRAAGERVAQQVPGIVAAARADRMFLGRAVTHLGTKEGIRQYLDVGTGLPTASNTHEIAQRIEPCSRIVYVDNDPLVLTHARALLTSTPEGATDYLHADLRDPERILAGAAATLDLDRPVAVMLLAVLHLITDDEQALGIVRTFLDALPAGSHLVLAHACSDVPETELAVRAWNASGTPHPVKARSRDGIARFFEGLRLLEPGIVSASRWRADPNLWGEAPEVMTFCGVGRKT